MKRATLTRPDVAQTVSNLIAADRPIAADAPRTAAGGERAPQAAPDRPAIWVRRLSLMDFRCYATLRLDCAPSPVVLTGPNGAGKTNLLEALSFLIPGRGLRRARLADIRRRETPDRGWAVAASVETPAGSAEIGTGQEPRHEDGGNRDESAVERRVVRIDGRPIRGQAGLTQHVSALWLTPEMDRIFLDVAATRRRFLDRVAYGFDPAHAERVHAYDHALRERARLLRGWAMGDLLDERWCAVLEDRMAEEGVAIAATRREVAARLAERCARSRGAFPVPGLAVEGSVETWLAEGPALDAEDRLRACLRRSRLRDRETGGAADGPHRSDLVVSDMATGRPAEHCSTGEQKALLIAIMLGVGRSQAEDRGRAPLLLLDEVAAHLDNARRRALYDELLDLGAQVWLTGTDEAMFEGLGRRAQFFRVAGAAVAPAVETLRNQGGQT